MKVHKFFLHSLLLAFFAVSLTSCFEDNTVDYTEWRTQNQTYLNQAEAATDDDGNPFYQKIIPSWASGTYALVHWNNDRSETEMNLSPLDNSTVNIKYETYDIEDNLISSSKDLYVHGEGIYQTKPKDMITGVRAVLPHMHVGDKVSLVLPYTAAYGTQAYGKIKPYSTLKFNIELVDIPDYEKE
ncbi:MAG: FKBP-type peptidyl-prolyl cis-trans isomerase [Muribaculaceae bacterium]|nr:FKBP-type peptidyl-prolyl cis-trans isomerase [Muribaculaceae bacterium]